MKKTTLIPALFFVTVLLFLNCSGDTIMISGKVSDEATGDPVPNRKIIIRALQELNEKFIPVTTDVFFSDSAGSFSYSIEKNNNIWLYEIAFVGDSSYAFASNRLGLTELHRQGRHLSFKLNKLTDFIMTIERNSKNPVTDTLYVSWECDGMDGRKLYPYKIENYVVNDGGNSRNIEFRWIGGEVQSAIKTKVLAGKSTIVHWELFRSSENKRFSDTIFCSRNMPNYSHFTY